MLGNFPDSFLGEIAGQADAMRRALGSVLAAEEALGELEAHEHDGVVFSGMGGSYAALYAPVTVLAGAGLAASMVDAAELLHYRRPMLARSQALVLVSQSGESAEVVRLGEEVRREAQRPLLISVTNGLDNPLARLTDLPLDTAAGPEQGPSTLTFAASLVTLAAVTEALEGTWSNAGAPRLTAAVEAAARTLEELCSEAAQLGQCLRAWLGARETLAVLGRGTARAAAEMGALLLKESARFPAESLQAAQFRHGPLELAGQDAAVAIIATELATLELDQKLAADLLATGCAVAIIGSPNAGVSGTQVVELPELDRRLAPAVALLPLQLLARELARERGLEPVALRIATKVTRDE